MNSVSVTGKNWFLKKFDQEQIVYLKDNFSLDEITAKLLVLRNIKREDVNSFLNPSIKNFLPNPDCLLDMKKSTLRTLNAIQNNEKIGIFGDYDVDGATSTALLGRYFDKLKLNYEIYIPDRKNEGYGPSISGFKNLIEKNVNLIFTVDCGTLSFEAINFAKKKNIDVIVLDHHQSEINLPKAYSVVNPNRLDDKSNLQYLCAVGVTFMFLVSINRELRLIDWFKKNSIEEPSLINYLDLVSLGTVCDVVPLVGLNRAIVKQGLKIFKAKNNLGLKTLIDICKIETNPSIYHLGYILGPRINAGGRVGKCSHGANLLLNSNPKEVFKIATELDQFNKERKSLEQDLIKKILIESENKLNDPVLILQGSNWHEGIIGIVAARLKDKFNKPTIIISINGDLGKASARSIVGFDIGKQIITAVHQGILLKGGGHKMAGGFTLEKENIPLFKDFLIKNFNKVKIDNTKNLTLQLDSIIAPSALNEDFFDEINILGPFGSGNNEPKFLIEKIKVISSNIVGDNHIKSILRGNDGSVFKGFIWNGKNGPLEPFFFKKDKRLINIAGKIRLNEWQGKKNIEFIIEDISLN